MVCAATRRAGAIFVSSILRAASVGDRAHLRPAFASSRECGPRPRLVMTAVSVRPLVTPSWRERRLQSVRPVETARRWSIAHWRGGRWITAGRYRARADAHVVRRSAPKGDVVIA